MKESRMRRMITDSSDNLGGYIASRIDDELMS